MKRKDKGKTLKKIIKLHLKVVFVASELAKTGFRG